MHLAQESEPSGALRENLVLHDLMASRDSRIEEIELFYWRTSVGDEVDSVVETGDRPLPVEVKAKPHD